MHTIEMVNGEPRTPGGRHANERLRRRGMIPAVIYGHGETPEAVALSRHDLELLLQTKTHVLRLKSNGRETQYLIKDVQYDHLDKNPIHVDLMRVSADERVNVRVPIEFKGTAKGATEGGVLITVATELDVECLLLAIPESIRVNVADMVIGSQIHVRDIVPPQGVTIRNDPEDVVAVVRIAGHLEAAPAPVEGEATTAEPELIGRQAKEETPAEESK